MNTEPNKKYPLEQLKSIKKNRFDEAVKILEEKKVLLDKAKTKLYDVTRERDEALAQKQSKLDQLRGALDTEMTTSKIQQMKFYLQEVVEKNLAEKEKKVIEQTKAVEAAQKQVDLATAEMFKRKKDLEKLEIHQTEWQKEIDYATQQTEALQQDEQGTFMFVRRKAKNKKRDPNAS